MEETVRALGRPATGGMTSAGESRMPATRKDSNGNHGFLGPVAIIVLLMSGYWLITEWHTLPGLIHSAFAAIR
jgi:hypothetical protein